MGGGSLERDMLLYRWFPWESMGGGPWEVEFIREMIDAVVP